MSFHPNKAQLPDSSMAAALALAKFFSLFTPSPQSPPPKCPPSQLSLSAAGTEDRWAPLIKLQPPPSCSSSEAMPVFCPSLAYASTLFFKSGYNVQVIVEDDEPEERLIGRFRREVFRAGVIQECKRRRFFENKREEKKRKTREAAKRNRRRRPPPRIAPQDKQEVSKNKKDNDDQDNWDLPQGVIPY